MTNSIICIDRYKIWLRITLISILMTLITGFSAAGAPYDSYVFNSRGQRIASVQAYLPSAIIDGQTIGIGAFNRPRDFAVAPDNRIYILDTGNNRLISLNPDLSLEKVITSFSDGGFEDKFANPSGITISSEGHLYIADTDNARIVVLDQNGCLLRVIGPPVIKDKQVLATNDIVYQPRKVAVDPLGRIYVIAANVYEGILQFNPDGTFDGFIGAPRVKPSIADVFWSKIASSEQRAQQQLFLPIEYANFSISRRGLLYAVVRGAETDVGDDLVKLLNPAGADIMRRASQLPIIGDIEFDGASYSSTSSFVDILGRENDMFSILDATRGRVFTYDHNGDLLYVFGGLGDTIGRFRNPLALERIEDTLLVLDSRGITVFEPTEYAIAIHNALSLYHQGGYDESAVVWQQILDGNPNYETAYNAIATNALRKENYELAMRYFRLGEHHLGYSNAFAHYRHSVINENISWIMTGLLLLIPLLFVLSKLKLKDKVGKLLGLTNNKDALKELAAVVNAENMSVPLKTKFEYIIRKYIDSLQYALYVIFHPFDGFWDLKHEKRGTLAAANTLLIMTILTFVFTRQYTAFIFNEADLANINLFTDSSALLLLFMLWVGINWAFTTLMEGKGTLKDIYIMSAYALTPFVLLNIPSTLVSHVLTQPEGDLLLLVKVISVIWSVGLLILGSMVIHDYTGLKTIVTMVLIICGIAASLFVGMLFTSVIDHVVRFVLTIYTEITYLN